MTSVSGTPTVISRWPGMTTAEWDEPGFAVNIIARMPVVAAIPEKKLHDRKTSRQLAAEADVRHRGRGVGGAAVSDFADRGRGKNDAAAGRISGHAERHLQLRHVHAVRGAEFLQGGRGRDQPRR